jgi:hypothetical protein
MTRCCRAVRQRKADTMGGAESSAAKRSRQQRQSRCRGKAPLHVACPVCLIDVACRVVHPFVDHICRVDLHNLGKELLSEVLQSGSSVTFTAHCSAGLLVLLALLLTAGRAWPGGRQLDTEDTSGDSASIARDIGYRSRELALVGRFAAQLQQALEASTPTTSVPA